MKFKMSGANLEGGERKKALEIICLSKPNMFRLLRKRCREESNDMMKESF